MWMRTRLSRSESLSGSRRRTLATRAGSIILCLIIAMAGVSAAWTLAPSSASIPSTRTKPLVVDEAGLLTTKEKQDLIDLYERLGSENDIEIAVVTVNSLEGKSAMDFADDFFDYNGYGVRPGRDGILLLVSMEERDWWISTHGTCYEQLTEQRFNDMSASFLPDLSAGRYYKAFASFGYEAAKLMQLPPPGSGGGGSSSASGPPTVGQIVSQILFWLVLSAGGGLVAAFAVTSSQKAKHKTVRFKSNAEGYLAVSQMQGVPPSAPGLAAGAITTLASLGMMGVSNRSISQQLNQILQLHHANDVYLRTNVTSTARASSSSSSSSGGGGGGFGGHTSSSGSTHGGGGGKF